MKNSLTNVAFPLKNLSVLKGIVTSNVVRRLKKAVERSLDKQIMISAVANGVALCSVVHPSGRHAPLLMHYIKANGYIA